MRVKINGSVVVSIAIVCGLAVPASAQTAQPSGAPVSVTFNAANAQIAASYTDSAGAGDIQAVDLVISNQVPGTTGWSANACVIEWRRSNQLFLVGDAGGAWSTFGITVGTPSERITNSQCLVRSDDGTSVALSGNSLSLNLNLSFAGSPMGGSTPGVYLIAEDGLGRWSSNFTTVFGHVPVPVTPITPCHPSGSCTVSISPLNAASATFAVNNFDAIGTGDIASTELWIANVPPASLPNMAAHQCVIQYVPSTHQISVINDAGTAFPAGSLANSQCSASLQAAQTNGPNNLVVRVVVNFTPAFAGTKGVYLEADSGNGFNNNFQNLAATYNVP